MKKIFFSKITINELLFRYLFNCEKWLATSKDDGKICRELPALDLAQSKHVKFREGVKGLKDQIALETEGIIFNHIKINFDEDFLTKNKLIKNFSFHFTRFFKKFEL